MNSYLIEELKKVRWSGKTDEDWTAHLDRCDTCNYDRPCMMCEVGPLDDFEETRDSHGCNCRHGRLDNGWHLKMLTRIREAVPVISAHVIDVVRSCVGSLDLDEAGAYAAMAMVIQDLTEFAEEASKEIKP